MPLPNFTSNRNTHHSIMEGTTSLSYAFFPGQMPILAKTPFDLTLVINSTMVGAEVLKAKFDDTFKVIVTFPNSLNIDEVLNPESEFTGLSITPQAIKHQILNQYEITLAFSDGNNPTNLTLDHINYISVIFSSKDGPGFPQLASVKIEEKLSKDQTSINTAYVPIAVAPAPLKQITSSTQTILKKLDAAQATVSVKDLHADSANVTHKIQAVSMQATKDIQADSANVKDLKVDHEIQAKTAFANVDKIEVAYAQINNEIHAKLLQTKNIEANSAVISGTIQAQSASASEFHGSRFFTAKNQMEISGRTIKVGTGKGDQKTQLAIDSYQTHLVDLYADNGSVFAVNLYGTLKN